MAMNSQDRKKLARELLRRSNFTMSDSPVGIITAGLPGAGKTEFTQELLKQTTDNPIRLDMDEIAACIEGYKPQMADKFREDASAVLSKIYDEVIKRKIHFVLDGTFAGGPAISNVQRAVNEGYAIKLFFIYQDPRVAWDFTIAREKIEHRAIDRNRFIDAYYRIYANLERMRTLHLPVTFSIIMKDKSNKVGALIENVQDIAQLTPPILDRLTLENKLQ